MGKTIGLTGALETYYAAHACREVPVLAELRAETAKLGSNAGMQIIEKTTQPLQFSPWAGLAVFAGWVAVAFVAGLVLLRRRDV